MLALSATALLQYERNGWLTTPGLVAPDDIRLAARALDTFYESQQLAMLRQKVRVLLGEATLAELEAEADPARSFRRRLNKLPCGSVPFLQCFNAWRDTPQVLKLLRSLRL